MLVKLAIGVALIASDPAAAGEVFADAEQTEETVRTITQSVAALRGLPAKRSVPVFVEDPATMRARMEAEIAKQLDPETLEGIEWTWRLLALVPDDFDLASAYAAVLESAVGGYFDIEEGRLVLVRREMGASGTHLAGKMMEDMVIAHELVHGLQDQHFDLWALTRRELENGDVGMAIQTLVEGDASYAMLYRLPIPMSPDQIPMENLAPMMAGAGGPSADPGGTLGEAPRILKEPLIYPYIQGLIFVQKVKLRGSDWTEVDKAYAAPPLSTEQTLHPEKYGPDGDWPMDLRADATKWLGAGTKVLQQDTMGEFGLRVVLGEHTPDLDVNAAAAGWDGDRLFTLRRRGHGSLVWRSTWDSEADASEFFRAAEQLLGAIQPDALFSGDSALFSASHGRHSSGVEQRGQDVVLWSGVPRSKQSRVRRNAFAIQGIELRQLDQVAPAIDRPSRKPE